MAADTWEDLTSPALIGGWDVDGGSGGLETGLQAATRTSSMAPLWSPDNPLFWAAVVLVIATGGIYLSSHLKVGPLKASASV